MAVLALTEEQQKPDLASLNPEMRYICEEKGVDLELMGLIGHHGIVDNDTFAAIATDGASLRSMLKSDFGVDVDGDGIRQKAFPNVTRALKRRKCLCVGR